ncbi:MAG: rRNA maturation RNase YbeY [Candidatus Staskawiczbacteria bacterium RIFCSPLOWO2_01_FULL_33_9]|uniref:Endoribonuclease YbeY n=1 Tax=Candidatus Staskawiczbacteria bacterium RIFCSPLOWO2_01_FULL_33_9 TaxID=1802211 RepID=A0A1G2I9A5_9BACT|nr:MAG: rRNA maturation RNase YbeY [Candidatus Staskawiczbacteria bacterium RIFCSPLOWO2_01_FULL_33_9]
MIEINNLTNFAVDKKFFLGVAKKVLKGENRERENISIAFVNSATIKKLNTKYRRKHKPTDVLSFGRVLDLKSDFSEVVICPEVVKKNGDELAKILIHGILHVLGYDHEKSKSQALIMETKQLKYLSNLK